MSEVIDLADIETDPTVITARRVLDLYAEVLAHGIQIEWWDTDMYVVSMELTYRGFTIDLTIPVPDDRYSPADVAAQIIETFTLLLPEGD